MLDTVEKRIANGLPEVATKSVMKGFLQQGDLYEAKLFLKVLCNYLQRPTPYISRDLIHVLGKQELSTSEMQVHVLAIFKHMVDEGAGTQKSVRKYTTGRLAAFFGVTVATINNWLKEGRILGAEKAGANKQYRIPENALYISASGEEIPISEIAKLYEQEKEKTSLNANTTPIQAQKELIDAIVFFENKYGGEYNRTLGNKDEEELTSLEKRDAEEWKYLLRCLKETHDE